MRALVDGARTFLFDCDGVVLDSNTIKTQAFREIASAYGPEAESRLVGRHLAEGGVSRFEKFRWFVENVLDRPGDRTLVDRLVARFGALVRRRLEECPECPGATSTLARLSTVGDCHLVSGGAEEELRDVFRVRGLDRWFRGIHGSPRTKREILSDLRSRGLLRAPVVFFGDSRLDGDVAGEFGCGFVFLYGHTEMSDWQEWVDGRGIAHALDLASLGSGGLPGSGLPGRDPRPPGAALE